MDSPLISYSDFNAIPTLDDALLKLEKFQATQDMMVFGDIFLKHLVHGAWGLCLVHRHFDLKANEIMLEQPADKNATIVTKATDVSQMAAPFTGSSYRFVEGGKIQAFEYRNGSGISTTQGDSFSAFLRDLNQAITENELSDVLGLFLITSMVRGLETTNYEKRKNIVEWLADGEIVADNFAPAAWVFNDRKGYVQQGCATVLNCAKTSKGGHRRDNDHYWVPDN